MLTVDFDRLAVGRGDTILDLGCGAGRHSYEALRRGAHVIAADLDRELLSDVRDIAAGMAVQGEVPPAATFGPLAGDATRLPFPDDTFDQVIVSEVLEHIPSDSSAIEEVARILKPGGRAAVTVPRYWPERVCWALSDEYHSNDGGHVRIYRRSELVDKLRRAGLRPLGAHHAHALHSPYWWLKCAAGVERSNAPLPRLYHRFLVWQITAQPAPVDLLEKALNPVLGKSLVIYVAKIGARVAA